MNEAKNITFDLETLGNNSHAPIVQIGAVKFTDEGEVVSKFERQIDLYSLTRYPKLQIDYGTLSWWFNQDPKAIGLVFMESNDRYDLRHALHDFVGWVGSTGDYYYWSHATFDPPILKNNFDAVGVKCPIPYRLFLDIRTIRMLAGHVEVERKGVLHNALDDCIYQAEYISKMLKIIRNGNS